jgi:hypothetical protein
MQLRVIYRLGVQHAASDGPAGKEVGFGPIVKRETVIVLVNATRLCRRVARAV